MVSAKEIEEDLLMQELGYDEWKRMQKSLEEEI